MADARRSASRCAWLYAVLVAGACGPKAVAPSEHASAGAPPATAATGPSVASGPQGADTQAVERDGVAPLEPTPDAGAAIEPGHDLDGDGVSDARDRCPDVPGVDAVDTTLAGCPPRRGLPTTSPSTLRIGARIEFASGASDVPASARAVLDEVVRVLEQNPELELEVVGHNDALEPDDLAERRARAVSGALAARGISATRLSASGEGSRRPLASNATQEGRARNRRVEFVTRGPRRPLDSR